SIFRSSFWILAPGFWLLYFLLLPDTHPPHADHRVAGHECSQLLFAHMLGAARALGQHHVADLGAAVPDANLDRVIKLEAELAQDPARIDDRPRAVRRALVPDRGETQHRPRVA